MTSERVQKDRAYYQEFKTSRLDTQPDIDVEWYFDRVDELERQLAEAQSQISYEQERNRNNVAMADEEIGGLKVKLERVREALRSIADNTCCDSCQEAALVAQAALDAEKEAGNEDETRRRYQVPN